MISKKCCFFFSENCFVLAISADSDEIKIPHRLQV